MNIPEWFSTFQNESYAPQNDNDLIEIAITALRNGLDFYKNQWYNSTQNKKAWCNHVKKSVEFSSCAGKECFLTVSD